MHKGILHSEGQLPNCWNGKRGSLEFGEPYCPFFDRATFFHMEEYWSWVFGDDEERSDIERILERRGGYTIEDIREYEIDFLDVEDIFM